VVLEKLRTKWGVRENGRLIFEEIVMSFQATRKWMVVAIMVVSTLAVSAMASEQGRFEKTYTVNGAVNLEVNTHSGDVIVRSGSAGTVTVVGRIHVGDQWSRWFGDGRQGDVKQIENDPPVHQSGNTVRVDYVNYHNISVDYEITAPPDTQVRSRTGSGNQTLEGLHGTIDLQSGSGDVQLTRMQGEFHVETGSGNVHARDIAGPLRARAGSGDFDIEENGPGDIEAHTGSGNITVRKVEGAFRADAGSGDITADGTPKNSWTVRTGSGNVRLRFPSDAALDVDVTTSSGTINMDQPVTTTVVGRVQETRKTISGKVRGGGPLVSVRTGSGDIHIE
jgi:DUF4097 and DUF4098 domain-containing protein YvlB